MSEQNNSQLPFVMRFIQLALLCLFAAGALHPAQAGEARIYKVLPHFLDLEGRHSLSPSLFERDAYQDYLRRNPQQRSALRFDIQWKAPSKAVAELTLKLELRASEGHLGQPKIVETAVRPKKWFRTWSALTLGGEDFKALGEIVAWRASLWDGDQMIAQQQSFLW